MLHKVEKPDELSNVFVSSSMVLRNNLDSKQYARPNSTFVFSHASNLSCVVYLVLAAGIVMHNLILGTIAIKGRY